MESNFDTKTEAAFSDLMKRHNINCQKICEKNNAHPDFICELNNIKCVFELKDLNKSGTIKSLGKNFIAQNITIAGAISRFISACKKKFSNKRYINYPSALVITNLRPLIRRNNVIIPQVEKALKDNLKNHPEIGDIILAGYNQPSNSMIAFHIYENKNSERIIPSDFFSNFNHQYNSL